MKNNEKKNNKLNLKKNISKTKHFYLVESLKIKQNKEGKLRPHAWIKFQEKTKQAILSRGYLSRYNKFEEIVTKIFPDTIFLNYIEKLFHFIYLFII